MKRKMAKTIKRILYITLFLFFILKANQNFAQNLPNDVLYANGHKEYTANNWVYASVYLFAYIQRNPKSFNDNIYKKEVIAAYDYSVEQLNNQSEEYKKLVAKQKEMSQNQNGIGSSTQGLSKDKPVLRKPANVPMSSVNKQQ